MNKVFGGGYKGSTPVIHPLGPVPNTLTGETMAYAVEIEGRAYLSPLSSIPRSIVVRGHQYMLDGQWVYGPLDGDRPQVVDLSRDPAPARTPSLPAPLTDPATGRCARCTEDIGCVDHPYPEPFRNCRSCGINVLHHALEPHPFEEPS